MLKPLRGLVLIEPIKDTDKTSVGVYLPESAKDKPQKGKVIAVGAVIDYKRDGHVIGGWSEIQPEVKEGDTVVYKKWGNEEVKEDGKEYVFVRFEDILGVYE